MDTNFPTFSILNVLDFLDMFQLMFVWLIFTTRCLHENFFDFQIQA